MTGTTYGAPGVLGDILRRGSEAHPDRPAVLAGVSEDRRGDRTYRELDEAADRAAAMLQGLGVRPGDRVAFCSQNRVEYYEALFGATRLGAAIVPINWRLAPREVAGVLADARPSVLVMERELAGLLGGSEPMPIIWVGGDDCAWSRRRDAAPVAPSNPQSDRDRVMWQIYTSGTTGSPKGVELMHRNMLDIIDGLADAWHFEPGCVVYLPYPSFHAVGTGWPVITMHRGGTVVLRSAFDPADFVAETAARRVTLAMMVPAVLNQVLNLPGVERADLSSLRHVVYGAAPISQTVLSRAIEVMPDVAFHHAYGLTEATGTVTTMQWEEHRPGTERMRSCGRALPWVEMQVRDPDDGRLLATREVGEVWMRGPTVMRGYFDRPDETAAAITDDGWLRTGDAGYVDADGYLYLTDRVKDMIISGGENVYPAEVEDVVFSFPGVREAAVVGVPDERWGETVLAVVVPEPGAEVDPDSLIAYTRERLAHYKCPTVVEIRDEPLPLNPTGKVLRRQLREPYWAGHDRRIS